MNALEEGLPEESAPQPTDWLALVSVARIKDEDRPAFIADDWFETFGGMSMAVGLRVEGGAKYVVKTLRSDGADMAHALATEVVAARLGRQLGCPIPEPALVFVPKHIIGTHPQMAHVLAGLGHAVGYVTHCGDKLSVTDPSTEENRTGYASLAVLYGWFRCESDHQLIRSSVDLSIWSVDHGLFLPGQQTWTAATLGGAPEPVVEDIFGKYCSSQQIGQNLDRLRLIADTDIADAVAAVPSSWGVPQDDLLALCAYLADRRDKMVESAH